MNINDPKQNYTLGDTSKQALIRLLTSEYRFGVQVYTVSGDVTNAVSQAKSHNIPFFIKIPHICQINIYFNITNFVWLRKTRICMSGSVVNIIYWPVHLRVRPCQGSN